MTGKRLLLHSLFLFLLPVIVAWLGISTAGAFALVLLALLWRWAISLSAMVLPAKVPELELETIAASHFVEKVRWCMDRLGVEYSERAVGATLGAFFLGRTVPVLWFRSGAVRSSIGNSPEILRYLWGRYSSEYGEKAGFLKPTAERLDFEQKIDRCGVDLQVWVYYHLLNDRDLTLHAWGCNSACIPAWHRLVLKLTFPLLRFLIRKSFRITPQRHAKAVDHIGAQLAEADSLLADGRQSILGGDIINYTDITFAAVMGLWVQPPAYGGGRADEVRVETERFPSAARREISHWREQYPLATRFIEQLYQNER
jgi:glutathione S-transferase